jgi:DNA polymerase III subunit gamma/tau
MISLAVKYRPKIFADVTEQTAIKQILLYQLKTKTTKNCYLFTGGAGTGKTTCARILADDINGGKGLPIEIDGASNNGVENVREIIENAKFKNIDSEYKIYIIDECHMLSTGAWNAMLKLIEEPPAKTMFIFCTTDPQKIPATILSRVQRYDFQRITFEGIVTRLAEIIKAENGETGAYKYDVEKESLEYIAKLADGGMRDAITLLDKCVSFSNDLTVENVTEALGTVNFGVMIDLTLGYLNFNTARCLEIIDDLYMDGKDLKAFIKSFISFLVDVNKYYLLKDFHYIKIPSTYVGELDAICSKFKRFQLLTMLDAMISLSNDIKWESDLKTVIESYILLRLSEVPQ